MGDRARQASRRRRAYQYLPVHTVATVTAQPPPPQPPTLEQQRVADEVADLVGSSIVASAGQRRRALELAAAGARRLGRHLRRSGRGAMRTSHSACAALHMIFAITTGSGRTRCGSNCAPQRGRRGGARAAAAPAPTPAPLTEPRRREVYPTGRWLTPAGGLAAGAGSSGAGDTVAWLSTPLEQADPMSGSAAGSSLSGRAGRRKKGSFSLASDGGQGCSLPSPWFMCQLVLAGHNRYRDRATGGRELLVRPHGRLPPHDVSKTRPPLTACSVGLCSSSCWSAAAPGSCTGARASTRCSPSASATLPVPCLPASQMHARCTMAAVRAPAVHRAGLGAGLPPPPPPPPRRRHAPSPPNRREAAMVRKRKSKAEEQAVWCFWCDRTFAVRTVGGRVV